METEILQTLQEIRGILYLIAGIFFIGFTVIAINSFLSMLSSKKLSKSVLKSVEQTKSSWIDEAIDLFETGNFESLIAHCKARQNSHKLDSNAYYWQARAYRETGDSKKAKEYFAIYSKMSPENHSTWVEPYLDNG